MSKIGSALSFLFGVAIGGAGMWYYLNERYIKPSEQDILSIKETYRNREKDLEDRIKQLKEEYDEDSETPSPTVLTVDKVKDKGDVMEFVRGKKYTQYMPSPALKKNEQNKPKSEVESSYVVSPDEFGELDGYTQISLTYYADGILADENGIIIDDVEEIVGDALDHFGEYEDDSVFCRNDPKRCDYEILKDLRRYADVRKSFPPNL